jgi:hypothetical protein
MRGLGARCGTLLNSCWLEIVYEQAGHLCSETAMVPTLVSAPCANYLNYQRIINQYQIDNKREGIFMIAFNRPLKGCRMVASDQHPHRDPFDYIGEVVKVDGNQVVFRNRSGEIDRIIWKFRSGKNPTIYFGA